MPLSEAVVVYDGHGVTSRIRSLSGAAISVQSDISPDTAPTAGEDVTVFLDGVGKFDSRVTFVEAQRIDLAFLTDTQERWRQLQSLKKHLPA